MQALKCPPTILNVADALTLITRCEAAALPAYRLIKLPQFIHDFLNSHTGETIALLQRLLPQTQPIILNYIIIYKEHACMFAILL